MDAAPSPTTPAASGAAPSNPAPASSSPTPKAATPTGSSSPAPVTADAPQPKGGLFGDAPKAPAAEASAPAPEPEAKPEPFRYKFKGKIDGREIEEEYGEDELQVLIQKGRAADKRFQEAAARQKQIEQALGLVKEDPFEAFKNLGIDLDELAEQRLASRYEEALMSPEEKQQRELQRKVEQYEKAEAARKQAEETRKRQEYEQRVYEETERSLLEALESFEYEPGFKKHVLLPMMADIAEAALEYGIDLTPSQMAAEVEKRMKTVHQRQVQSLKGKSLLQYLGADVVKEVIRAELEARKLNMPVVNEPVAESVQAPVVPEDKPQIGLGSGRGVQNFREWMRQ